MRRIVVDTNVYISAYNFDGIPDQVLHFGRERRVDVFICLPILSEIRGVLKDKFQWPLERIEAVAREIGQFTKIVELGRAS